MTRPHRRLVPLLVLWVVAATAAVQEEPPASCPSKHGGINLLAIKTTLKIGSQNDTQLSVAAEDASVGAGLLTWASYGANVANSLAETAGIDSAWRCHWYSPGRVLLPFLLVAMLAGLALTVQLRSATRPPELAEVQDQEATAHDTAASSAAPNEAVEHAIRAEVARTIGCYFAILDGIVFTMVIPDSYDMVIALGGNAVLSGAMIGAHKFGTACGALAYYCVLRWFPLIWRTMAKPTLLLCATFNLVGTATYAVVAAFTVDGHAPSTDAVLLVALFAGRTLGGMGSGIRLMATRTQIARLTAKQDRPQQQSRFLYGITLGVGIGPLLAVAVKMLDICPYKQPRFLPIGVAGMTLSIFQLVAASNVRHLHDLPDLLDRDESRVDLLDEPELQRRRCLIMSGLAFSVVRGLCLSGVEAASAMLLEVRFSWHPLLVGLTIGLAFLTCIPLRMVYLRLRDDISIQSWIRLLMGVSVLGSLLLFRPPMQAEHLGFSQTTHRNIFAGILLVGDGLLFPCFFLSDGLVQGLILQHPLPAETSWLNLNGVNLINTILLDGVARVVGPALSRFHVSAHGQNAYAAQQLALTLAAGAIALFGFLPKLGYPDDSEAGDSDKLPTRRSSLKAGPVPGG